MNETNNNQTISVKFNFSNEILQRVSFLQFKASEYFRNGEIDRWFFEWKNIKHQLIGKLKEEEQLNPKEASTLKELRELEAKISLVLSIGINSKNKNKILGLLIEKYLTTIQYKIEEWGMGLVNRPDETSFA